MHLNSINQIVKSSNRQIIKSSNHQINQLPIPEDSEFLIPHLSSTQLNLFTSSLSLSHSLTHSLVHSSNSCPSEKPANHQLTAQSPLHQSPLLILLGQRHSFADYLPALALLARISHQPSSLSSIIVIIIIITTTITITITITLNSSARRFTLHLTGPMYSA